MTKEAIIEQIHQSLNEHKGLNEAIDDAAFYIAAEFDKVKENLFSEKQLEEAIEMEKKIKGFVWEDGDKLAVRYNTSEIIQSLKQPKK
jgi:hypothetical protein